MWQLSIHISRRTRRRSASSRWFVLALAAAPLLVLPFAPALAQQGREGNKGEIEGSREQGKGQSGGAAPNTEHPTPNTADDEDLPILLYVAPPLPEGAKPGARRDDPITLLNGSLREMLRGAHRYQVVAYSPTQTAVRRALLEHAVDAVDFVPPVKPEAWQKLAKAIGARYIFTVDAVVSSTTLTTNARFDRLANQNDWLIGFTDKIETPIMAGRRRLKPKETVALATDAVAVRLQIPSHLADDIHVNLPKLPVAMTTPAGERPKPDSKSGKTGRREDGKTEASMLNAPPVAASNTALLLPNTVPTAASNVNGSVPISASPTTNTKHRTPNAEAGNRKIEPKKAAPTAKPNKTDKRRSVSPDANVSKVNGAKTVGNDKANTGQAESPTRATDENPLLAPLPQPDTVQNPKSKTPPRKRRSINDPLTLEEATAFAPDAAPVRLTPAPPTLATTSDVKPDYEAQAQHYGQTGDTANAIRAWRYAVNDQPENVHYRIALAQAYLDRKLWQEAMEEADRALHIAPENVALVRLRGDVLLARGQVAEARKAYEDATRLAPNDIATQVALGDAALRDNSYKSAIEAYEVAARNDPKNVLPHRRLARALVEGAAADRARYAASLKEVEQVRTLVAENDKQTYTEDYTAIIHSMDQRLRDLLEELQGTYEASVQKRSANADLLRIAKDVRERAEAAADYLDALPPAVTLGQAHAQYVQGALKAVEAASDLEAHLKSGDTQQAEEMKSARMEAYHHFADAAKQMPKS